MNFLEPLLRLLLWLFTRTVYRLRIEGAHHVPARGGALVVCNRVSMGDAILLLASISRPTRFFIPEEDYDHPLTKLFAPILRVIPISSRPGPRDLIHSSREAREALHAGEAICIFADGQMTSEEDVLPFRVLFERITEGVDTLIIPANLDNPESGIFGVQAGRFRWKLPRTIPCRATISFGPPMASTATPLEVRQATEELHVQAYRRHRERMYTIPRAFIRTARRHPFRFAMADARTGSVSYGSALVKALFLARRLKKVWDHQSMAGILLPPSVPGALVNHAALLMGKIPVNLNYTASAATIASGAAQCGIETVITSRAFLERLKIQVPGRAVFLEELVAAPRWSEKLLAFTIAWTLPGALLQKAVGARRKVSLDDLATIIFSSGSTGEPKGVMLTHFNIGSNIDQIGDIIALDGSDRVLGILPFFHAFGFTVTLALPATLGLGVVFHPNPFDAAAIGDLVRHYVVTILIAPPSFLQIYLRRCRPEDFASLRVVVVGAEKPPAGLAAEFENKFGILPIEGYGCTECGPAVGANCNDFLPAVRLMAKPGQIGLPLPGMSALIVDPETMARLPAGQAGLLLVRGPNVMKGYWQQPEMTSQALHDGWYRTGDIASRDEDGFLEITDRVSRFSKIGGEMVPHLAVEEKLQELVGLTDRAFAVTGIRDAAKGERLVVLHTLSEEKSRECIQKLSELDLPNLWKPRADQFFRVDALPLLGIGKLDLRTLRETAQKLSGSS